MNKDEIYIYWSKIYTDEKIINAIRACELNGFGRAYLRKTLQPGHLQQSIQSYFNNFVNHEQQGQGLFIFGSANTGKTIAVTVLAKNIMMIKQSLSLNYYDIYFCLYDDLVRLALSDKSFTALETIIKQPDILVLDNIGNETGLYTQARSSVSLLDNILRNREMSGKLTWLTTNIDLENINTIYTAAICNIIKRTCKLICSSA